MPAFYWSRACPGMYYLRDAPRGSPGAKVVAKSIRRNGGKSYLNTVGMEGATPPTGWGGAPKTAIAWTEDEVRRIVPGATFTRENF